MSILFYRRPDYNAPWSGPINASECQRYVERAKGTTQAIPKGLSFDEVINNKALPPCSLKDWMDYLIYVERNAENLQFYLWYNDYVRRWNELPAKDRVLSPKWQPDTIEISNLVKDREDRSSYRPPPSPLVKTSFDKTVAEEFDGKGGRSDASSFITASAAGSVPPTAAEINSQAGLKWQPFTIQPFREECDHILRHYIAHSAPRELNLSHRDRSQIIHALQHTTDPSAFAPAFAIADATLRSQSHPNFIRWSICNGNKPRVVFVRGLGVQGIALGFALAAVLTLSHVPRWYRLFAALLWFMGFSTIIAAYKGLCLILHTAHSRNLHPWELADDAVSVHSAGTVTGGSGGGDRLSAVPRSPWRRSRRRLSIASTCDIELKDEEEAVGGDGDGDGGGSRGTVAPSVRSSLNTFGPKNEWVRERWLAAYSRRGLVRKVFEKSTWTQDETLKLLQDRIVIGATVWSLIVTVPLTIVFVALPKGNYF